MPLTIDHYFVGKSYMVDSMIREKRHDREGVEILQLDHLEENGRPCIRTKKIYHLKSQIPEAIRWAVPDKYLHFHEESVNNWPHIVTIDRVPGLGEDFMLECESDHIDYYAGMPMPDNPVGLPSEQLAMREVVYLDILGDSVAPDPPEIALEGFLCPEVGIALPLHASEAGTRDESLPPKWTQTYEGPMICVCKVVKLHFKWFGLQTLVNNVAFGFFYPKLFTNSHRKLLHWAPQWVHMSKEDLIAMEQETIATQGDDFERDED